MAHEITVRANGQAEMAYLGNIPWHGLGNKLEVGADLKTWEVAAGMDWEIQRAQMLYALPDQTVRAVDDKVLLHRSDSGDALGIVSERYQVVQPADVLGFFQELVETVDMQLETAGTLFGGKRFWALAKAGDEFELPGHDRVGNYLLLATSADGTMQTQAKFTSVRVVCNNTLGVATASKVGAVSVRHTTAFSPTAVRAQLGLSHEAFDKFKVEAGILANTPLPRADAAALTAEVLGGGERVESSTTFKVIMDFYDGNGLGAQLESSKDTAWGWVNAVTQYVDHSAKSKTDSHRMNSAWFGRGNDIKSRALALALR